MPTLASEMYEINVISNEMRHYVTLCEIL